MLLQVHGNSLIYKKMIKVYTVFAIILVIFSCENRPCDNTVNGACPFPEISDDLTIDERFKLLNLSEETLECITTEGLVETCLSYPDLRLLWTRNSLQLGYDYIRSNFNGLRELEARKEAPKFLLKKYLRINPATDTLNLATSIEKGEYSFSVIYLALIFNQYTNIEPLTKDEIVELIEKSLFLNSQFDNEGLTLAPIMTLLGRLMKDNDYEPFVNAYNDNPGLQILIITGTFYSPSERSNIINLSENYLEYLKNL